MNKRYTIQRLRKRGITIEERVCNILRRRGFFVYRHPYSFTPDIFAFKWRWLFLIEVKSVSGTDEFKPKEDQVHTIMSFAEFLSYVLGRFGIEVIPLLAVYFVDYGVFGVKPLSWKDNIVTVRDSYDRLPLFQLR